MGAVEEAVADGGSGDVADAAVIERQGVLTMRRLEP